MRVGLFGGSFDPVHFGHLHAADWALHAFGLETVRLVPAKQSPFKGTTAASDEDRREMLARAIADNPDFALEECELRRPAPSYTIDTLRELALRMPAARFVLILGSDTAAGLDGWKDAAAIRATAEIRVLDRRGDPGGDGAPGFRGPEISSSGIRTAVRAGSSVRYLVPEPVRLYIEEKGLYR